MASGLIYKPQPHPGVLGNYKDLWAPGPVICFSSILVSMPSSQFYLLKCLFGKGAAEGSLSPAHWSPCSH